MIKSKKGFSLIEVIIAVAIVAIIAAIAMPSYLSQVTRTRCSDGIAFINRVMQNQERSFTNNLTYTTDLTTLGYANPTNSPDGFYAVTAAACAGTTIAFCVQLTATGQGSQAGTGAITADTNTNITLNSRGQLVTGGACD